MSANDYFRFVTQEIVKYMDAPKDERKKNKPKEVHQYSGKWFGVLPFALKLLFKRKK